MKTLILQIPDDLNEKEVILMPAVQLYDKGKLLLGKAAVWVGMNKEAFMEQIGNYDVTLFGEKIADIRQELQNG